MASDAGTKNVSMISIGERLKSAREKKNISIDQVQKQTHIHSSILMALEEGRCAEILGSTYVKSFLKKYSTYLGLDSAELLKEYSGLKVEEPVKPAIIDKIKVTDSFVLRRFIRMLKRSAIFVLAVLLIMFVGTKIIHSFKARKEKPKPPVKSVAVPIKKSQSTTQTTSQSLSIPAKEPLKLVLKVKQNVLIKFKRDGISIYEQVLKKGTTESFTAESRINLYIAKAEAVELVLNSKPVGPLGRGILRDVEITRSGVKIK